MQEGGGGSPNSGDWPPSELQNWPFIVTRLLCAVDTIQRLVTPMTRHFGLKYSYTLALSGYIVVAMIRRRAGKLGPEVNDGNLC